jgi:hypothetical protein
MKRSKRGEVDLMEVVVFIILNGLFFSMCFVFVYRAGNGSGYMEQIYAEKIALALDQARGNSTLLFSFDEPIIKAKKAGISEGNIITINSDKNTVTVKLASGKGFTYEFFSNIQATPSVSGKYLKIKIEDKHE